MRNLLFVVSGPSGVGKGTLVKRLLADMPSLTLSVSCTTRAPRPGEENGREYFFVSEREFSSRIRENDFLEYDEHFGQWYGTPRSFVERKLKQGSVVLEIDVVGGLNAKRLLPGRTVLIMIVPPSLEALKARLYGRDAGKGEDMEARLVRAKYELEQLPLYDYEVVNDDLETALQRLEEIVKSEIDKEGDKR